MPMQSSTVENVAPPKLRPGFRLFRSESADLWASALFGIAHAGGLAVGAYLVVLVLVSAITSPRNAAEGLVLLAAVLAAAGAGFILTLIWLGTIGGVILWLFSKSVPEPRTRQGWVALCAAAGGVIFFCATLPFWTRLNVDRLGVVCLLLSAGTAVCQAGGAWGVNRALRLAWPIARVEPRRIRFTTRNLLWLTLNVSLFFFVLRLFRTQYEAFLPLAGLWLIFQFASLAMGAVVVFSLREALAIQLYDARAAIDDRAGDVPRGTDPTPTD